MPLFISGCSTTGSLRLFRLPVAKELLQLGNSSFRLKSPLTARMIPFGVKYFLCRCNHSLTVDQTHRLDGCNPAERMIFVDRLFELPPGNPFGIVILAADRINGAVFCQIYP